MKECEYRYICPVKGQVEGCPRDRNELSCIIRLLDYIEKLKERQKKTETVEVETVEAGASEEHLVYFLCDHRACDSCDSKQSGCTHTLDVRHAKNFQMNEENFFEV